MPEHSAILHSTCLFVSPLIAVHDVGCRAPRSSGRRVAHATGPALVLARRGVFAVERHGETRYVDPGCVLILRDGDEYRVSHPTEAGDHSTVLGLSASLFEDGVGGTRVGDGRVGAHAQMVMRGMVECLSAEKVDELAAEELALRWLHRVAAELVGERASIAVGPYQRLRVERARGLLAEAPERRWTLHGLGTALDCSPFHLARQFRAVTGDTICRYLTRLRVSIALERLAGGERDLTRLATDLGFAHHSHFGARFRALLGVTPRQARDILSASDVARLAAVLDASPESGARS